MSGRAAELVADLVRTRGKDGRCRYHKAAKRELVRRCLEPGVSIAATAMAHGVNANLLRKWVDALSDPVRPRGVRSLASAGTVLLPVRVAPEQARDLSPAPSAGSMPSRCARCSTA